MNTIFRWACVASAAACLVITTSWASPPPPRLIPRRNSLAPTNSLLGNILDLDSNTPPGFDRSPLVIITNTPRGFWDIYAHEFAERSTPEADDQFGFAGLGALIDEERSDGSKIFRNLGSQESSLVNHLATESLRETSLQWWDPEIRRLEYWSEEHIPLLGGLVSGSVGNTVEEDLSPDSASYAATTWRWIKKSSEDSPVRYGIRPFNLRPYGYINWAIGGAYKVVGDMRWYYDLRNGHDELTATTAFPIGGHYRLIAGFSGQPFDLRTQDLNPPSASLVLARDIGNHWLFDILSIGVSESFDASGPHYSFFTSKQF